MNLSETAQVLALCAAFDRRTVGEADVYAWQSVISADVETAKDAVKAHYGTQTRWIMPADINTYAKTQAERDVVNERRQAALRPRLALTGTADGRYGQRRIAEPSPWYVQAKETLQALRSAHPGTTAGGSL